MERIKYFRSCIVPNDRKSMVYWAERWDGENFDIHPSDVPENEIVKDLTYDIKPGDTKNYIKKDGKFIETSTKP